MLSVQGHASSVVSGGHQQHPHDYASSNATSMRLGARSTATNLAVLPFHLDGNIPSPVAGSKPMTPDPGSGLPGASPLLEAPSRRQVLLPALSRGANADALLPQLSLHVSHPFSPGMGVLGGGGPSGASVLSRQATQQRAARGALPLSLGTLPASRMVQAAMLNRQPPLGPGEQHESGQQQDHVGEAAADARCSGDGETGAATSPGAGGREHLASPSSSHATSTSKSGKLLQRQSMASIWEGIQGGSGVEDEDDEVEMYVCPVYMHSHTWAERTGNHTDVDDCLFDLLLPPGRHSPQHWVTRNVLMLVCSDPSQLTNMQAR